MTSTLTLGRVAGIPIGLHYTWLLAFSLIAFSLANGFFPSMYPGWDVRTYWLVGLIASFALFASVLVHELSHSLLALRRGLHVHGITLFIFGGVSHIEEDAERPRDEFFVAAIGPLTSFVLAGAFWLAVIVTPQAPLPVRATLAYLATINLFLGAFNLLPAFPLDGGRVLRSVIWGVSRDLQRATRIASYVGQAFAVALLLFGAWQMIGGNILAGVWTIVIAWFLNDAAQDGRRRVMLQDLLHEVRVADLMNPMPATAHPRMSIQQLVTNSLWRTQGRALPVLENGRLVGIVSVTDVKSIPHPDWELTPVGDVMTRAPLTTIDADSALSHAIGPLLEGPLHQVPVVRDGNLVGLLTRAQVLVYLEQSEDHAHPAPTDDRDSLNRAA